MREIKFRFWRGELGMLYIDLLDKREYRDWQIEKLFTSDYPIMQYTGLKDHRVRAGEIYEGDILRSDELNMEVDVFYSDGAFCVLFKDEDEPSRLTQKIIEANNLRIIGNIYENPELVK